MTRVIDVCGFHYDLSGWRQCLLGIARTAPIYLKLLGERLCAIACADPVHFSGRLVREPEGAVDWLLESRGGFDVRFDTYAATVAAQGVSHQILHGWAQREHTGLGVNDYVANCARAQPNLFSAWAGLSMRDPAGSARELQRCARELGVRGATLIPFLDGVAASEATCKPIYDALVDLDLPVWIHTGHHFNSRVPLEIAHWRHIDAVAAAYPQLRILVGHGGWPWIAECVSLCRRHANVYLDLSTHRPSHMTRPGSGWAPLLYQAVGAMSGRVMFGSSSGFSFKSIAELVKEAHALPIPASVTQNWLHDNAQTVLLGGSAPAPNARELLSMRQVQVLQLAGRAFSAKSIARGLELAPGTVKWHLKNIYDRLGAVSKEDALAKARALRII